VDTRSPADLPNDEPAHVLQILVVDDVAMNRDIAGSILRAAGHKVICVESAVQAVMAVAISEFDVVLMDVHMPDMDGLEATRRIRALGGARERVPIVGLTAHAYDQQVEECRKAGMNGHLSKPFDPDTLAAAVVRAAATEPGGNGIESKLVPIPWRPPVMIPVVSSDLPIFNTMAFERTISFLTPDAVASCLQKIAALGDGLLLMLQGSNALGCTSDEIAVAAHTVAGSAGMLGFDRLSAIGRRFEWAVESGSVEAPALAESLIAALKATLTEIRSRTAGTIDS
jgi:CheY-like chemotaxis protein